MAQNIRSVYTLTWDPPEVAGGTHVLSNGTTLYFHGAGVQAFNDVVEALNMTIEILYGNLFESLQMVGNGSAEIGTLLLSHSADLFHSMEKLGSAFVYLHPLVKQTSNVYFRQPPIQKFRVPILAPFSNNVWFSLISMLLIVTLLTSFAFKLSHIPINLKSFFNFKSLLNCCICAIEHYCGRIPLLTTNKHRLNFKPDASFALVFNTEIVKLFTTFSFYFIITIYTAKVVSHLIKVDEPIKTPEDLFKYNYVIKSYSHIHIDRLFMKQSIRQVVLSRVYHGIGLDSISNVVAKSISGAPHALLSHSDGFYPQAIYLLGLGHDLCSVSSFQSSVKTARSYFIRKDSKLRESFNIGILQLIERGLNHRHQRWHENKYQYYCPSPKLNVQHLTINHISFALGIIAAGIFSAIINMLYLIYLRLMKPRNTQINDNIALQIISNQI